MFQTLYVHCFINIILAVIHKMGVIIFLALI